MENLLAVFTRNAEHGFRLRSRCVPFDKLEIRYLGSIVNRNGRRPNSQKIEVSRIWTSRRIVRHLRAFLGVITYCAAFMPKIKEFRGPLDAMLKKDSKKIVKVPQKLQDNLVPGKSGIY
ncbi:unnamed protein product [Cylicostephanus goldi]|uniref:Reverse transcriptase domain-containing protein n=1 Tax=Cylicostephanus goldi TaxID=71465 RepID=A0A3P6QMW0_CYLGO|nr:unnamed protein product [Cylicostephanus goldi]